MFNKYKLFILGLLLTIQSHHLAWADLELQTEAGVSSTSSQGSGLSGKVLIGSSPDSILKTSNGSTNLDASLGFNPQLSASALIKKNDEGKIESPIHNVSASLGLGGQAGFSNDSDAGPGNFDARAKIILFLKAGYERNALIKRDKEVSVGVGRSSNLKLAAGNWGSIETGYQTGLKGSYGQSDQKKIFSLVYQADVLLRVCKSLSQAGQHALCATLTADAGLGLLRAQAGGSAQIDYRYKIADGQYQKNDTIFYVGPQASGIANIDYGSKAAGGQLSAVAGISAF